MNGKPVMSCDAEAVTVADVLADTFEWQKSLGL